MDLVYSVIIPVYNAEKYLEDCVQSVLNQTSASGFEIILVNDGSRDSSPEICDRYAAKDPRIQVIHQVNQGVSVARNAGITAAKGQYVLFLDSDDLWAEKLLACVDRFVPTQADIVEFGHCRFLDDKIVSEVFPSCVADGETGETHLGKHEMKGKMPIVTCWAAAFRRQFLLENQLQFPLGVGYGEDFCFYMSSLKHARTIYTIDKLLYRYRENELSVTRNPNPKRIRDVLSVCAGIYRMIPNSLFADYYCMSIWTIEGLKREKAMQLYDLLQENRDILNQVAGSRARFARLLYSVFGWYDGAKLLRMVVNLRNMIRK